MVETVLIEGIAYLEAALNLIGFDEGVKDGTHG